MYLIGQSDMVVRALFVFLSTMLFASVYLFLIKAINLSCRACHAKRFLHSFSQARSLQQVQELVDRQVTIESFSRVAHRILAEKTIFDATADQYAQVSGAHDAVARRLIAQEAAEQAVDIRRGLNVLAAMVWAAPATGLAATVWRAVGLWLHSARVDWKASDLWAEALVMMQLGSVVAIIALVAYLCLLVANRLYLSQFVLFGRLVMPLLEPGGTAKARDANGRHDFPRTQQSKLNFEI